MAMAVLLCREGCRCQQMMYGPVNEMSHKRITGTGTGPDCHGVGCFSACSNKLTK